MSKIPALILGASVVGAVGLASFVMSSRRDRDAAAPSTSAAARSGERLSFNEHIQPIISANCYHCHGSDAHSREADLRLDRAEFAFAPRKDGPIIVRGDPAKSPLVRRIESTKPDEMMPPPDSHKSLKPAEIALLRRWVEEGAEYQEHWAFTAPVQPNEPKTRRTDWGNNPIDRFVLARLEQEDLAPNDEADRYTLIRRVTFDLTGLPPTPEEISAFLDDQDPRAYERVVDRLLASPRYGEHRARYWLDAARYSDTHGLHIDNFRLQWPYRDYVIRSFNQNKPFDRFATEQLAGDLLPVETFDQIVATGFLRAHQTTSESGEVTEELQLANVTDRVDTFGTVFLGLTASCASCHDHKFDPLSQKEFYQLSAYFNNGLDPPFDDEQASFPPTIMLPPPEMQAEAESLLSQRVVLEKRISERLAAAGEHVSSWLSAGGQRGLKPVATDGLLARFRFDEGTGDTVRNSAPGANPVAYSTANQPPFWGEFHKYWPRMRLATTTRLELGQLGDFDTGDAFSVAGWFQPRLGRGQRKGTLVSKMMAAEKELRGWELYWDDGASPETTRFQRWVEGRLTVNLQAGDEKSGITVRARPRIPRVDWSHLAFTYDGSGKAAGIRLYINGDLQTEVEVLRDSLAGRIRNPAPLQLGRRTQPEATDDTFVKVERDALPETSFQDLRLYARALADEEIRGTMVDDVVAEILRRPSGDWTADERHTVTDFYFTHVDAEIGAWRNERAELDRRLAIATECGTPSLIYAERNAVPMAHVLSRGVYNLRKERVLAGVPAFLPPPPSDAPRNRLGLARWLFLPEHPLTARVTVNRMWQEVFGAGLVTTPGDFGIVGARPSHFQLLDWLAVDFRESGWDVKRFYRQVVLSATYRQAARVTPELLEKDPTNRLFARGPRFRLDAEVVRDSALAASGLLVERLGGPSVNSYQPPGLWEVLSMDRSNTRTHQRDSGEGLYRRSVYTFWKRMAPPPVLTTFDAPQRDVCTVQRERTNTPLQALILLNAPDFLEAARHLAGRAMRQPDSSPEQRIDYLASLLLTKPLPADDRKALAQSYEAFRSDFSAAEAHAFLQVGDSAVDASLPIVEQAAWTVVASQLLNTDQAINK